MCDEYPSACVRVKHLRKLLPCPQRGRGGDRHRASGQRPRRRGRQEGGGERRTRSGTGIVFVVSSLALLVCVFFVCVLCRNAFA